MAVPHAPVPHAPVRRAQARPAGLPAHQVPTVPIGVRPAPMAPAGHGLRPMVRDHGLTARRATMGRRDTTVRPATMGRRDTTARRAVPGGRVADPASRPTGDRRSTEVVPRTAPPNIEATGRPTRPETGHHRTGRSVRTIDRSVHQTDHSDPTAAARRIAGARPATTALAGRDAPARGSAMPARLIPVVDLAPGLTVRTRRRRRCPRRTSSRPTRN
jgi:hypothetical protein